MASGFPSGGGTMELQEQQGASDQDDLSESIQHCFVLFVSYILMNSLCSKRPFCCDVL